MGCFLGDFAMSTPKKVAVINATTGESMTYKELDDRSNRFARYMHELGLRRGDRVAVVLENHIRFFEIAWAAFRSGLLLVAVNKYLTADEAAHIINDSESQLLVSSWSMHDLALQLTTRTPGCHARLMIDGTAPGWTSYELALEASEQTPLEEQWMGGVLLYSSGTTGRPKGVVRRLVGSRITDGPEPGRATLMRSFGFGADTVYLSTAPLYHAAALSYATNPQFVGGTTVFMEKFDSETALRTIERYRITHSQWVPTMFIRMLKLPEAVRVKYDLATHRMAIHSAAPCPAEVKRRMIEWWGPIVNEYYTGTEGCGMTIIDSHEALARPGSVGKAVLGTLRICDEAGGMLPAGREGLVYFEREFVPFHYHNNAEKTRAAQHPKHLNWTTLGDIGRIDEEGYLYLTDRRDFMIISGGVNIYPRAVEDELSMHPKVSDVAVFGIPHPEMGESVHAVVEPVKGIEPSGELADELLAYLDGRVARYMIPRSLDFIETMPRLPTGKLYKRVLRERYV